MGGLGGGLWHFLIAFTNSSTPWKRPVFKISYSRNSQISVWKTNFFPRRSIPKFFLFYTLHTLGILHTEFNSIWTTLRPHEKDLFLKLVIREIRKFPFEKLTFFLGKLYQKFFSFYTLHTLGILHTEFDLIWTTPWPDEKDSFLKLIIREIRKSPYEKITFFLGKLYQKFFLFYTLHTLAILHTEFGLMWTFPWPDEKDLFLNLIIREIRKFPYEKLNFFLGKLYQKFFSFYTLHTLAILHTEFGLIWTFPWPDEKDPFLNLIIREFRKFPYEKLIFFLGKLYQKFFFVLQSTYPWNTPYRVWFIWTTPWPDEKYYI